MPRGEPRLQSTGQRLRRFQGAGVTPVGDIEFEIVFRIVVRGRTRDLAQLLEAMRKAGAVVMWVVEGPTESEEQGQKDLTVSARGFTK